MRRRSWLATLGFFFTARAVSAFGQQGSFHARLLKTAGGQSPGAPREAALGRWAWELVRRTSAPGRLVTGSVNADDPALLDEPFCVWAGSRDVGQLAAAEVRMLREYLQLGGVVFVDDSEPASGVFGRSARRELQRVLPEVPVVKLPTTHVVYKSYYLVERPVGRVNGPPELEGMLRGRQLQVLFSSHDLLGALARGAADEWSFQMEDPDPLARQQALRLAVNIAMYVLCSDYKDDQVHAEELMRRRGRKL